MTERARIDGVRYRRERFAALLDDMMPAIERNDRAARAPDVLRNAAGAGVRALRAGARRRRGDRSRARRTARRNERHRAGRRGDHVGRLRSHRGARRDARGRSRSRRPASRSRASRSSSLRSAVGARASIERRAVERAVCASPTSCASSWTRRDAHAISPSRPSAPMPALPCSASSSARTPRPRSRCSNSLPRGCGPSREAVERGFADARIPGRMEVFAGKPPVRLRHRAQRRESASSRRFAARAFPGRRDSLRRRDRREQGRAADSRDPWPSCRRRLPSRVQHVPGRRAIPPARLAAIAESLGALGARDRRSVRGAHGSAPRCRDRRLVVVTGSTFVVAELREWYAPTRGVSGVARPARRATCAGARAPTSWGSST